MAGKRTVVEQPIIKPTAEAANELVVLVHGLAARRTILRPLERALQQTGYQTLNWGYPSIRGRISSLGVALSDQLRSLEADRAVDRFHLVTHSMGCILARAALVEQDFGRLGRVVMLGPPHGGSRVAGNLARWLGWLCPPLAELSDHEESLVNRLPEPIGCEIGIVAAARDRVVSLQNTHLACQADHIVVNRGHTSMLFGSEVADQIETFLRCGQFARPAARSAITRQPSHVSRNM